MSSQWGISNPAQRKPVQIHPANDLEGAEGSGEPLNALPLTQYDPLLLESSSTSYSAHWDTDSRGNNDEQEKAMRIAALSPPFRGRPRNKVITQHTARWLEANPPVIYQATIFDAYTGGDLEHATPVVTYQDDRPFQFARGSRNQTTTQVDTAQPDESTVEYEGLPVSREEKPIAEWAGPVFEIKIVGKAQFWDGTTKKGKEYIIGPDIPKTTEDLLLEKVSRPSIVLKSHHLLHALEGLVGYYPSFHASLVTFSKTAMGYIQIGGKCFQIDEPFAVVMHHFQSIKKLVEGEYADPRKKDSRDFQMAELQRNHMKHLYKFAEPLYHAKVVLCEQYLSEACPRVAFDMVWYLLKPGTDVYVQSEGTTFAGVVLEVIKRSYRNSPDISIDENEQNSWLVNLWHLNTDGARIRRTLKSCTISRYSELRDVTELPVYPASIWDAKDKGERRKKILARSRTFFKALQQGNLLAYHDGPIRNTNSYYTGKVVLDYRRGVSESDNTPGSFIPVDDYSERYKCYDDIFINDYQESQTFPSLRSHIAGRTAMDKIIVRNDAAEISSEKTGTWAAWQAGGRRDHVDPGPKSSHDKSRHIVQELTDHQLLLLHPETLVYGLKLKQWMVTSVDYIREIISSSESLSNLIIGGDELQTIRALSNKQNSKTKQWSADFIEGKGSGQIILLHGPPGVGKTYTVEAISEWLHRPLLALTVADIGTIETRVEKQLFKWFDLAEAWNAVLLVDEADIFLERRQNRDLSRNGLVSAFLRRMEYFKGLLFLTTNRVGQIDDAFISRVHVAIGYNALNAETRKKIWHGFFQKLARERAGKIQIALDAKKWVLETTGEGQAQLNGRDIRNALQTAITLAKFESEEDADYSPEMVIVVTKDHFQRVLEMSNKFHNYVTSIRREDERRRAQGRGDRNDYDGGDVLSNQLSMFRQGLNLGQ